ncbi:hypothetical protein BD779DRAFT_1575422 [Infundibulicybe gibba]|nr:hypothetical protein BD779DRAFT_1575422 [Infundibulicybe gibba]
MHGGKSSRIAIRIPRHLLRSLREIQGIEPTRLRRCKNIISPANSYNIMFGLELSRYLKGTSDLWSLTDYCQEHIHDKWHGYTPPGSCTYYHPFARVRRTFRKSVGYARNPDHAHTGGC